MKQINLTVSGKTPEPATDAAICCANRSQNGHKWPVCGLARFPKTASGSFLRSLLMLVSALILAMTHCASKNAGLNSAQAEISISSNDEGFLNEDTLAVMGSGVSSGSARTPLQKRATAKESARMDAQQKVVELCRGISPLFCGVVDNWQLASSAVGKELVQHMKRGKIKKLQCKDEGDQIGCKVLMVIEQKGIKRDCELAMSELARQ